jgi:hypothetical protein
MVEIYDDIYIYINKEADTSKKLRGVSPQFVLNRIGKQDIERRKNYMRLARSSNGKVVSVIELDALHQLLALEGNKFTD